MRKFIFMFLILTMSGLVNLVLGQKFTSVEAMVGHRVFFRGLADSTNIFKYVYLFVDGKLKAVKPKDQLLCSELLSNQTVFFAKEIVNDKKGEFLVMGVGDRIYYFMIRHLMDRTCYNFCRYALDYNYVEDEIKAFSFRHDYVDAIKLHAIEPRFPVGENNLLAGRFAKVQWLEYGLDSEGYLDAKFKIGDYVSKLNSSNMELFLDYDYIPTVKNFSKRVEGYKSKFPFFDMTIFKIDSLDSSKTLCKYFYPMKITQPYVTDSLTSLVEVNIDGNLYLLDEDLVKKGGITADQMRTFKNHFESVPLARGKYHYVNVSFLNNNKVPYNKDGVLYGKFYPITILAADLSVKNELQYWMLVDTVRQRITEYNFAKNLATENDLDNYKKAYEQKLEEERLAREELERKERFEKEFKAKIKNLTEGIYVNTSMSVRGNYAYLNILRAWAFGDNGYCAYSSKAEVDKKKLTNSQKNDWNFIRLAGLEALSYSKEYRFPYEIDFEAKTIKVDVSELFDESKKPASYRRAREFYDGPIFPEFCSYREYLDNRGEIPLGLSKTEWEDFVYDATGRSPVDLNVNAYHSDYPVGTKFIDERYLKPEKHYWFITFNVNFTTISFEGKLYKRVITN